LASGENHPLLDLCYAQVFAPPKASEIIYLRGDFQLVNEDRCLYCSKLRLYKIIRTLFPFIPLSLANYYRKTAKLREAENRTDLCPQCEVERKLRNKLVLRKGTATKLTEDEQRFIALWAIHRDRASHQRRMLQSQIDHLMDDEACIIADFKENIRVPFSKDSVGHDFFNDAPITLISFVTYTWNEITGRNKNVFTVLSS
jgi:hypothetical protein